MSRLVTFKFFVGAILVMSVTNNVPAWAGGGCPGVMVMDVAGHCHLTKIGADAFNWRYQQAASGRGFSNPTNPTPADRAVGKLADWEWRRFHRTSPAERVDHSQQPPSSTGSQSPGYFPPSLLAGEARKAYDSCVAMHKTQQAVGTEQLGSEAACNQEAARQRDLRTVFRGIYRTGTQANRMLAVATDPKAVACDKAKEAGISHTLGEHAGHAFGFISTVKDFFENFSDEPEKPTCLDRQR